MPTALVIGGTGLVGGHLVELLLADPHWSTVKVLARAARPNRARLEWCAVDFTDPATWQAHATGEVLFNCMGTTIAKAGSRDEFRRVDFEVPLAVARAACARGTGACVSVSSLGADPRSRLFYSRVKGELEVALSQVGFACVDHVRPSLLLGDRAEPRRGEKVGEVVLSLARFAMVGPLRRYRAISAKDVAAAMVILASRADPGARVHLSDELAALAARA